MTTQKVNQIAKITLSAQIEYLPELIGFVSSISQKMGLDKTQSKHLELITEETCLNVIKHAFDPDEKGVFDVILERKPGKIVVAVEDRGLPFDFSSFQPDDHKGLGMLLMRSFADEINFLNIGRSGKRVELCINLNYEDLHETPQMEEVGEVPLADPEEDLTLRLMTAADAANMSRCIYRAYGYTYGWEFIYYPQKIKEYLQSGFLTSCIYLNSKEEIIGHFAMLHKDKEDLVGETGMAVVDPRYRGRGLFKKMKLFLADHARQKGIRGFYSEAVAVHPYSQKGNISLGAHETGVLLGMLPSTMFFRKIQKKEEKKRQPAVFFYFRLQDGPPQKMFVPLHHRSIITKIIIINKLNRTFDVVSSETEVMAQTARLDVSVIPEHGFAFFTISNFGSDLIELVKFRLREMCLRKIDCIYIDLPLQDSRSRLFCAELEMLGFFFAGVIPEMKQGDILRLQFLNNVDINPNEIVTASPFGEELAAYVISEYNSMMSR